MISPELRRLGDRVAIVTGASSGIGAAVAKAYAAEGARVVINYSRNTAGAEATKSFIVDAGGEAIVVKADVSDPDEVHRMVGAARDAFGPTDTLVNNAATLPRGAWSTHTEEQWDRMMAVNLKPLFVRSRRCA